MNKEEMTIHKALSELKIIGDRIENALDDFIPCAANKHTNEKINGIKIDDFKKEMMGSYDKVTDLIKRRDAIKSAVVLSNGTTKVTVGGQEYYVAEAIEMKNSGIRYKKMLLQQMERTHASCINKIEENNGEKLERRAEEYVVGMYGSKEKANPDDFERTKKDFLNNNKMELVDPLHIKNKIDILEKEIAEFTTEVDAALSVSNALTVITIEY